MSPLEVNLPATALDLGSAGDDHQAFGEQVAAFFRQAEQEGTALSVIVAGLDSFRLVNDSIGWEIGDRVLQEFRVVIASRAGPAYRVGGDMLASLLPEVSARAAVLLAEKLRAKVASAVRTPIGEAMVSLGVASYPESAHSEAELVYGAEAAMYWAKAVGGNKVGYWGDLVCAEDSAWRRKRRVSDPITALVAALERKTGALAGQTSRAAWYAKRVAKEIGLSPAR